MIVAELELVGIDAAEAEQLETEFLSKLEAAGAAYEAFTVGRGWVALGYDSFAEWWGERVMPRFRALEVKPTRALAARVIDQVRDEEQALPPLQRRTQEELGELVGGGRDAVRDRSERSTLGGNPHGSDLVGENRSTMESVDDPLSPEIGEAIDRRIEAIQQPQRAAPIWSTEEYALLDQVRAGRTVVASMRGQHDNLIRWAEAEGKYVRIDRRSEWGNPFEIPGDGDRATVINSYAHHYLPHKPSLLAKLGDLRGTVLGCWCAPEPCHGDVLAGAAQQ